MMDGIRKELAERLAADYGFRAKETPQGEKLVGGRCPVCGRPEAHTPPDNPWVIICPRERKCGQHTYSKALYPEVLLQFARHHPPTHDNPHATVDAWLLARGFDLQRMRGWYAQSETADPEDRQRRYPTARFTLSNGVAYHRLIDYAGRNKTKAVAAFQSAYWAAPGFELAGRIWLPEGVLHACALEHAGCRAAATISSGHVPTALFDAAAERRVTFVIAQDNDAAGRKGAARLAEACAQRGLACEIAFPPENVDWDELLLRGDLSEARSEETLEEALWRGRLFQALDAEQLFAVWRERRPPGLFTFRDELWVGREGDPARGGEVRWVGDFTVKRLYRLRLEPVADRPEYSEVLRVRHAGGEEHDVVLSGAAMAKNAAFREALFTAASAQWDGLMPELNLLLRRLRRRPVPVVRQIECWGYDRPLDSYFFHDAAYGPDGRRVEKDERAIVKVGLNHARLPAMAQGDEFIWKTPAPGLDIPRVLGLLERAAPRAQGLTSLGYFTAALFADQVAAKLGMFPFLSLYGDTHTGKSTLLVALNRMLGRDWEGAPVSEANTKIGTARFIGAYSNLPVVLIEADAHKHVQVESVFNLRSAYNRGPIRITGQKTADNTTRITPFRGALVFGWNEEQLEDAKVKERMVSLLFLHGDNSDDKIDALNALQNLPHGKMAGYLHEVLTRRKAVLEAIQREIPNYQRWLEAHGVTITRTALNHAVPLAGLHAALEAFLPDAERREELLDAATRSLLDAAIRKERELRADPDDVEHFFDRIAEFLRGGLPNYAHNGAEIAVSLREVQDKLADRHLPTRIDYPALKRSPHFVKANFPYRKPDGTQIKCWVFRRQAVG
jgi:hypothetical protein